MGHEGCCGECADKIDRMAAQLAELSKMAESFAESMSKIGESPMARTALRTMGVTIPDGRSH